MGAAFSPLPKYIILEVLPSSLTGSVLNNIGEVSDVFSQRSPLYETLTGNMNTVSPAGPEGDRIIPSCRAGCSDGA